MIHLILHFVLLGVVIYAIARNMRGIYVESYGTALGVAVVYGLINLTLGTVFKVLTIPLIVLTFGLFLLVINTFLLRLTDAMFDGFEIEDLGTTFIAAILITLADTLLGWIF